MQPNPAGVGHGSTLLITEYGRGHGTMRPYPYPSVEGKLLYSWSALTVIISVDVPHVRDWNPAHWLGRHSFSSHRCQQRAHWHWRFETLNCLLVNDAHVIRYHVLPQPMPRWLSNTTRELFGVSTAVVLLFTVVLS
jgi:hypothetical protein